MKQFFYYILSFLSGALFLSGFSAIQKTIVGAPISMGGFSVPFAFGGFAGLIIYLWNLKLINEIKHSNLIEEQLRESEKKFRSFSEQSLVGIYLIQDSVFKYVNPKFAEIFGYNVEECLGNMPFNNLVHPDDIATVEKQVRKRTSGEIKSIQYTCRGVKKSGE